jgi:hypothetical protein
MGFASIRFYVIPSPYLVSWPAVGSVPSACFVGASRSYSLYALGPVAPDRVIARGPPQRGLPRECVMSLLSKVRHSRNQWKHKARQRANHDRYRRKQLARVTPERDRATHALHEAQARLRQIEAQSHGLAVHNKADLVF